MSSTIDFRTYELLTWIRYSIATADAPAWAEAEKQIGKSGKSTTVAVAKPKSASNDTEEGATGRKGKGKGGKEDGEKKRKASAMEEARRELEKVEASHGKSKKKKQR